MMRTIGLLLGVLFVALLPAAAQEEKVEVFGGYSYMRLRGGADLNLNGWEASAQYKFRDWIGGVADFDGHYGSPSGIGTSVHSFLFGPQGDRHDASPVILLCQRRAHRTFEACSSSTGRAPSAKLELHG